MITRESHAYNNTWDTLSVRSKQLLEALAVAPCSQIYSSDFLKQHSLSSPSSVQRAVKSLERAEIIERENDTYMFTDVFFKLWIEKGLAWLRNLRNANCVISVDFIGVKEYWQTSPPFANRNLLVTFNKNTTTRRSLFTRSMEIIQSLRILATLEA